MRMFICLLAGGILLARPCLADDIQHLEMSVGDRQNMARHVGLHSASLTQKERMWPNNKIPYTYHISLGEIPSRRASVEEAIRNIEKDSCLEFEDISDFMEEYMKNQTGMKYQHNYFHLMPPPPEYPDYIFFTSLNHCGYRTDTCYSENGRIGGIQAVTLGDSCLTRGPQREIVGRVQHEILHTVGSLHEMNYDEVGFGDSYKMTATDKVALNIFLSCP